MKTTVISNSLQGDKKRSMKGFTLIELILYMGIFSILMGAMMQIFFAIFTTHLQSQSDSSVDQDGSYIISRLTYDLHQASALTVSGNTLTITGTKIGGGSLNQSYAIDANNNLVMTDNVAHASYQLNGPYTTAAVIYTRLANTPTGSKPSVQIKLTLTSKIKQNIQKTEEFDTTIATR